MRRRRKPYVFELTVEPRVPERLRYWITKTFGQPCGIGAPGTWTDACRDWVIHRAQWEERFDRGMVRPPCIPSNVEFLDETGKHTVDDLFRFAGVQGRMWLR